MIAIRQAIKLAAIWLWIVITPIILFGQTGGGSIVGFVIDQSQAPIPGVEVKATNLGTGVISTTVTDPSGYYEFPLLPEGSYTVKATQTGFSPTVSASFTLSTGTRPRVDLTLQVAGTTSRVEVTARAPLLNATTTDLGNVVGSNMVTELPLDGRNWQSFVGLEAGGVAKPSSATGNRGGMQFNGSPAYGNELLLDGVDMTFGEISSAPIDQAGGAGTSLIGGTPISAIAEVKISSSSYSAEYGDALGGVVNITTKSGTNQYHGEVFEFDRNDKLDANSFFSNLSNLPKPALRWNQFGGDVGGPIKKNKLFFFIDYEGARVRSATALTGLVPTPLLLSEITDPALAANAATLPTTYTPTTDPLVGYSVRNQNTPDIENDTLARLDYYFGKQRLAVRYSNNWSNYVEPFLPQDEVQIAPFHYNNLSADWTNPIRPTMLNEFRFGYSRINLDRKDTLTDSEGTFSVASNGLQSGADKGEIHYEDHIYTFVDNLSAIRGAHSLKAGVEIIDRESTRVQPEQPYYYFGTMNDLINDTPPFIGVTFGPPKSLNTTSYAFYGEDTWRLSRKLMLNAGLRYEHFTPLTGMFNVNSSNPFGPFIQRKGEPMFASHWNDWGPRLGVAWNPTGSEKLVVRAGGGLTYMPQQPMFFYDFAAVSPLIPSDAMIPPSSLAGTGFSPAFPFPGAQFEAAAIANPDIITQLGILAGRNIADYNSKDFRAGQWNLSVQSALTASTALQVSYVGNHAWDLYVPTFPDQYLPNNGPEPLPAFGSVQFTCGCASSSYDALQVSLNQRAWHGLVFNAYYTWGKTLSYGVVNDTNNVGESNVQDVNNMKGSYGPVDGDIRNMFTLDHTFLLPTPSFAQRTSLGRSVLGGWSYDGIMMIRSGLPVNVLAGSDLVRNQRVTGDRPNIVPGVNPYIRNTDTLQWLNPAAFDATTPYNEQVYGNLAYNALFGPGGFTYDASLHKAFKIKEIAALTFRAEAFNVFNHVVFNNPVNSLADPQFGQIQSGSTGRAIQLALLVSF